MRDSALAVAEGARAPARPLTPPHAPPAPPPLAALNLTGVEGTHVPPTPTLFHVQKNAGMFATLRAAAERQVVLNAAERTIVLFADAKGAQLSAVLRLDADGVRIVFAADAPGTKAPDGWSALRLEITAPSVGDAKPATHVFRTRNHADYCGWAAALAAL